VTPKDWERLKLLFGQALSLPPEERAAFAEKVRLEDEKLGGELADLIAEDTIGTLDAPLIDFHKFLSRDTIANSQLSDDER
jgi:hypothetical protein